MEMLYKLRTMEFVKQAQYKYNIPTIEGLPVWDFKEMSGLKRSLPIHDLSNGHLSNIIDYIERRHPNLKGEFEKVGKLYGYEQIYMISITNKKTHKEALIRLIRSNPMYFLLKREALYRMYEMQRKIFKYTTEPRIDYYGTEKPK